MDLDMNPIVRASNKLRRQLGPPIQGKHLLNLEPTHPTLYRQTESLTTAAAPSQQKPPQASPAGHAPYDPPAGDQLGVHLRPPHSHGPTVSQRTPSNG